MTRHLCLLTTSAIFACTTGCASSPAPPPEPAEVRIANAEIGGLAFDVCVDGDVVLSNSRFGTITDYTALVAGSRTLETVVAGSDCDDLINDLFGDDATVTLGAGTVNTLVLLADGESGFRLDDDRSRIGVGQARVRLINASEDSLSLTVTEDGGTTLFDLVRYNEPGDYGYTEVDAGTYNLTITPLAGDMTPLEIAGVEFARGNVYTLFAVGRVDGVGEAFDLVVVNDAAPGEE
ncbi:MAG: DUF4397 domain-containing protein [Planctomycetota bacterium]|nr:DUF4397 domain-containing protein [Planctomycetota bacterium]